MPEKLSPLGQLLRVEPLLTGHTRVVLDNGPGKFIHILTNTEDAHVLLGSDLAAIRDHLMTRRPGHFRSKHNQSETQSQ